MHAETDDGVEPTFLDELPIDRGVDRAIAAEYGLRFSVDMITPGEETLVEQIIGNTPGKAR